MPDRGSSIMRLRGLLRKEIIQIRRDPSSIALAIVMPLVLLFIFGYGVSLDPKHVPIALVNQDHSTESRELVGRFELSRFFDPIIVQTMGHAITLMHDGQVDGIVCLRDDFATKLNTSVAPPVQLILNSVDANRSRLIQGYVQGTLQTWLVQQRAQGHAVRPPAIEVNSHIWFNESASSVNFLVPGLLTLIMTLIGTLLTALVIAREWERGTMEAILATPITSGEILLGKIIPYFLLGMCGMGLSLTLSVVMFDVPIRGSVWLLVALSALFMLASLGLGLMFSTIMRVQFVAAQVSIVAGFLPAFFLSGLLFDLQSTPLMIRVVSHIVPARYFVSISHTLFLAGDIWPVLLPATLALAGMATFLLTVTRLKLSKRLPQ
jgi:ABC-2 type transport system permease protein